jgi:hypothetical protein
MTTMDATALSAERVEVSARSSNRTVGSEVQVPMIRPNSAGAGSPSSPAPPPASCRETGPGPPRIPTTSPNRRIPGPTPARR